MGMSSLSPPYHLLSIHSESLAARAIEELSLAATDQIRFYVLNGENPELIDTTQSVDSYFDTVQKVRI